MAEIWDEDDEDRQHTPLSSFARDQGEMWYDHDFLEYDCEGGVVSFDELVDGHSYSSEWAEELARRIAEAGLSQFNMIVFIDEAQIRQPRSVRGDGYWLSYLGTIKYAI